MGFYYNGKYLFYVPIKIGTNIFVDLGNGNLITRLEKLETIVQK